jgi:hypothetical protein
VAERKPGLGDSLYRLGWAIVLSLVVILSWHVTNLWHCFAIGLAAGWLTEGGRRG